MNKTLWFIILICGWFYIKIVSQIIHFYKGDQLYRKTFSTNANKMM